MAKNNSSKLQAEADKPSTSAEVTASELQTELSAGFPVSPEHGKAPVSVVEGDPKSGPGNGRIPV